MGFMGIGFTRISVGFEFRGIEAGWAQSVPRNFTKFVRDGSSQFGSLQS